MRRFKLANVLLEVEDFLIDIPEVMYRVEDGATISYDAPAKELSVSGLVDFCTYFNGLSARKWRQYTGVERVMAHLELAGDACTVALRTLDVASPASPGISEVTDAIELAASGDFRAIELDMPLDAVISGFAIMTSGTVRLRNAYYYVEVDEGRIRPVRLAVSTTTFRKEEYIVPNIERIRKSVIESDDDISRGFHMFVVDNGRTLDAESLSGGGVTVIPNPNVGGSGGFARGMIAALDDPSGFTHVLLMDDDVRMSAESFQRVFSLLSLVTDDYARACINGAMLELERPWLQFEDVAYARAMGGYTRVKGDYRITGQTEIAQNEVFDVEVPHAYGAWWYNCIPVELIREKGLPMPFFVRCDDVEYGVRLDTKYMTMNGICVWHSRFDTRFNAAVDMYQFGRNMFIMMALHDFFDQNAFMRLYWRAFHLRMRMMQYESVELWLDALEDYLKGPDFLMAADGAALMRENGAKCEKLVPVEELDPEVMAALKYDLAWLSRSEDPSFNSDLSRMAYYGSVYLKKLVRTLPYDRHLLPDFLLSSKPGAIMPGDSFSPLWAVACRKQLVALNSDATKGHVRTIDRERYEKLVDRYHALMKRYREENEAVVALWREKMPELTSKDFWLDYIERME